jgi:glycerophosphoryl diester phosphodiesterase
MYGRSVVAIAHRGASAYAPENTTAAFELALSLGARAVEFDVRLTRDGVPVVLHDDTLERTTSGRGKVSEANWADLAALEAGTWFHPRFVEQRVLSLEQALAVIAPRARPIIELKVALEARVLEEALRVYNATQQALVISFEASWLAAVRKASRDLKVGLLADEWRDDLPERCRDLGSEVLILGTHVLSLGRIAVALDCGLEVWTYTPNDIGLVAACAALGVTGIITDRPDLIRAKNPAVS